MIKTLTRNRRQFGYAVSIALGFMLLQQLYASEQLIVSVVASVVLWLVLMLELFTDYFFSRKLLKQLGLPSVTDYSKPTQVIYHALLPSLLFLALVGLIYTTNVSYLAPVYFIVALGTFSLLFINIRAYYEDKYKLEGNTHIVYDLIKIIIFFSFTQFVLTLSDSLSFNFFVQVGIVFVIGSLLSMLVLVRSRLNSWLFLSMIVLSGLAIGYLTASLNTYLNISNLLASFMSTVVFYIFNAILHHEKQRTLTAQIVAEYILVAALCLLIVLLLN